jgi:autotransporter translocation and assembly factor TamB
MGEGTVLLTGHATHEDRKLSDVALRMNVSKVKFQREKQAIVLVNSAVLTFRGEQDRYVLEGDVILGPSHVTLDFKPQSLVTLARKIERPERKLPLILQQTRMDVRLRESKNIWIDNRLARMRLHTELAFLGSPQVPNVSGRVRVEEGYLFYLDRKFTVERATIDFADPNRLNPIVDIMAGTSVTSRGREAGVKYDVALSLSGALDELTFELVSDPPLSKPDIVALLTLGRTRERTAEAEAGAPGTSVGEVLWDRTKEITGKKLTGYTERKIGGLLGLGRVTIEGDLFRFDRSWGPSLVASKKLSKRMQVTYATRVGYANEQSIQLDYRLSERFSLEAQTDQRGQSGIDLKYKLRFR